MSPAAGEFVTEPVGYDGGRQVTVYVPPVLHGGAFWTGRVPVDGGVGI